MLRLLASALLLAGCSSAPPASERPNTPGGASPEPEVNLPQPPRPVATPEALRIQQCSRGSQARPLQDDAAEWLREWVPFLGCPMSDLDDPLWGFSDHEWVPLPGTDGRAVSTRENDNAPGLNVFILPEDDSASLLYRVLKVGASADPAPVFQAALRSVREALGTDPIEVTDDFALFPRSEERPFRVRLSIEGADVALVIDR